MKSTIKLFLVIVIAAFTVFAEDGNMGNGGYADDGNMGNGGYTSDGNMGNGGKTNTAATAQSDDGTDLQTNEDSDDDSVLTFIEDYLQSLFG